VRAAVRRRTKSVNWVQGSPSLVRKVLMIKARCDVGGVGAAEWK